MKVYVASSWRNQHQQAVVQALREAGHEVYDFKNPPGKTGFGWSEVDPDWQGWTAKSFRERLSHPRAEEGYAEDFRHMEWADVCVYVQPCGVSASLELGWAVGAGKLTVVLLTDGCEPELMLKMADHLCLDLGEVVTVLEVAMVSRGLKCGPCGLTFRDGPSHTVPYCEQCGRAVERP